MYINDPMIYTMEQLVDALADEAMGEISFNEVETSEQNEVPDTYGGMWENIANAVLDEIEILYGDDDVYPYGKKADDVVSQLRPLLEPYNCYPAAHKLLSAVESVSLQRNKSDPRPYIEMVIRIFDSDAAKSWRDEMRAYI